MSTIAAALNSTGTLVAKDIAKNLRPDLSDEAQVRIGRISAVVVMLLAMLWSTQGGRFGSIFEAINKMPAQFIAPPIATVLLWGVFWRRGSRQAGVFTLALGFGGGLILFVLDLGLGVFGGKQWVTEGLGIPFMMQAWWLFCILSVFYFVVSLLTPAPSPEQVKDITWENPRQVLFHGKLTGLGDPRAVAGMLLVAMAVLYALLR
jgi:SSS family solute:Na+ symporter